MTTLTRIAWHDLQRTAPRPHLAAQDRAGAMTWLGMAAAHERAANRHRMAGGDPRELDREETAAKVCRFWAAVQLHGAGRHLRGEGLPLR